MAVIVAIVGGILAYLLTGTNRLVSNMLLRQSKSTNHAFSKTLQDYQDLALEIELSEFCRVAGGHGDSVAAVRNALRIGTPHLNKSLPSSVPHKV